MTRAEYEEAVTLAELAGEEKPSRPDVFDGETERKHPVLSNEEYEAAVAKARAKVLEETKDKAIAHLIEAETLRLQREEGFHSGDPVKDEEVNIRIDLPEFAAYLSINGLQFWHGHTYRQPRHVVDTLREMQQRTWDHQAEIDGKSKTGAYQRPSGITLSGKVAA